VGFAARPGAARHDDLRSGRVAFPATVWLACIFMALLNKSNYA
jgi:hypothetical protein